jgi:hypothetical protein
MNKIALIVLFAFSFVFAAKANIYGSSNEGWKEIVSNIDNWSICCKDDKLIIEVQSFEKSSECFITLPERTYSIIVGSIITFRINDRNYKIECIKENEK